MGASSRSPSPITTVPSTLSASKARRIASTAAWSASFFWPRPIIRAAAIAAISVTRTTSIARLRSMLVSAPRRSGAGRWWFPVRPQQRHQLGREADHAAVGVDAGVDGVPGAQELVLAFAPHLVAEGHRRAADLVHLGA